MGNRFSADDLENWKPKTRRSQSQHRKSQKKTQEYITISGKIDKNSLHLTREPSKHSRLAYMHALCDILQIDNIGDNKNRNSIDERTSDHRISHQHHYSIKRRRNSLKRKDIDKINKGNNKNKNDKIVKSLSLWNWRFLGSNDKYITRLARALQNNGYIETLHLVNCHIDCVTKIRILIEALKKRNVLLHDIDFSGNNFGNDQHAIRLLAIFLSTYQCTQNLKKITLRATKLSDDKFSNFVQILSQSSTLLDSLELFSVTHNKLKSQSMDYLTKWLLSKQEQTLIDKNRNNKDLLIEHLTKFHKTKNSLNLSLTTNPIRDSGVKKLGPLVESNIYISELHLRSCSITTRGVLYILNSYLIRQKRVIDEYCKLIYLILNEWISIPSYLCSIIIENIADWNLDDRLKIHFGLSRCSLTVDNGFNYIISEYIINRKLIAKCIDIRMKDTQNTDINIINIYKLFHYLKYCGNGCLGRLMFCVSSECFNIANQIFQLLPTNINEMDIDIVINNIMYQQTKYNKNYLYQSLSTTNNHQSDNHIVINTNNQHLITQNLNSLILQQNEIMNDINSLIDQRAQKQRKKQKMEDILRDNQVSDNINYNDIINDDEDEEDNQAIVDMILLEKLRKVHINLKQQRSSIYDNGDVTYQLNTNSDYGDFDATSTSYIDIFGDPIGVGFVV